MSRKLTRFFFQAVTVVGQMAKLYSHLSLSQKNCPIKMVLLLRIIYHILWSWFRRKWKGVNAVSTNQQNSYCLNIYCCHWSQEFPSVVSHRGCCLYDMDPTRSTQWAQFFVSLTYVVFWCNIRLQHTIFTTYQDMYRKLNCTTWYNQLDQ